MKARKFKRKHRQTTLDMRAVCAVFQSQVGFDRAAWCMEDAVQLAAFLDDLGFIR